MSRIEIYYNYLCHIISSKVRKIFHVIKGYYLLLVGLLGLIVLLLRFLAFIVVFFKIYRDIFLLQIHKLRTMCCARQNFGIEL